MEQHPSSDEDNISLRSHLEEVTEFVQFVCGCWVFTSVNKPFDVTQLLHLAAQLNYMYSFVKSKVAHCGFLKIFIQKTLKESHQLMFGLHQMDPGRIDPNEDD